MALPARLDAVYPSPVSWATRLRLSYEVWGQGTPHRCVSVSSAEPPADRPGWGGALSAVLSRAVQGAEWSSPGC